MLARQLHLGALLKVLPVDHVLLFQAEVSKINRWKLQTWHRSNVSPRLCVVQPPSELDSVGHVHSAWSLMVLKIVRVVRG